MDIRLPTETKVVTESNTDTGSVGFIDLYEKLKDSFSTDEIIAIVMDAGYITPYICKELLEDNILSSLPYKNVQIKFKNNSKKHFL